jgi:hypothetical protein
MLRPQVDERQPLGCRVCRMRAVTPIDQERHDAGFLSTRRVRQPPRQHVTAAVLATSAPDFPYRYSLAACRGRATDQVCALDCPADETSRRQRIEAEPWWAAPFPGRIRSDELEVCTRAQAKQRIVRPLAGVATPEHRAYACKPLKAIDLLLEVPSAPDEMINW